MAILTMVTPLVVVGESGDIVRLTSSVEVLLESMENLGIIGKLR